jgi:DNA-binding transcriptional ArsR family regulator
MDRVEQVATIFKVLSDPTRLKLIKLLSENEPGECPAEECNGRGFLCVNALAHRLGVTQSAVSQHLRLLRQAGLVRSERRGSFVHYTLDQEGVANCKVAFQETLGTEFAIE